MNHAHRIEHFDQGVVVYVALDPDGLWARSNFPHPLITVDYDSDDQIIGVCAIGPRVSPTLRAYDAWLAEGADDPERLVAELGDAPAPVAA